TGAGWSYTAPPNHYGPASDAMSTTLSTRTSRRTRTTMALTALLATLGLGACSTSVGEEAAAADGAIIGGVQVSSAKLDAVGSLQIDLGDGRRVPFCTGSLISPTVVVTAKH